MDALETVTDLSLEDAEIALRAALAEEGFGVLTEIDIAATFKAKLDVDRPPLKILGACNPSLAHRALELDPTAALLLPCNVVIEPTEDGRTHLAVVDPVQLLDDERLRDLADEATGRLRSALAVLNPPEA